ncbi:hypothetical protein [Chitinimonas sp.]|uniref:hypothetical protein n=1 Tax=Chitinimonas sp. TaxID=1934313 RepID=UPI002F932D4B
MNIPNLGSLLSSFPALSGKTGSQPTGQSANNTQTDPKANKATGQTQGSSLLSKAGNALSRIGDALSKRVSQLNDAVSGMASQLAQGFAKYLLGDAADGATISFDQTSIASSSSFAAAALQSQDANGTTQAAGFSLQDSSEFKGHGTITTKDGRSFEFEVEISYSSSLQAVAAQSTSTDAADGQSGTGSQPGQGQGQSPVHGHGHHHGHGHGKRTDEASSGSNDAAAQQAGQAASSPLFANFAGNAADLLDRLTSEPIRLPFTINFPTSKPAQGSNTGTNAGSTTPASGTATPTAGGATGSAGGSTSVAPAQTAQDSSQAQQPLQGSMLLKLLNLPDGPRYLDLLPRQADNTTPAGRVDALV